MDVIKTITDWPVLVQGALGSAIFWFVLEVGQRLAKLVANRATTDRRAADMWAVASHEAVGESRERAKFICIYAALHYFFKAAVVGVLSLALAGLVDVVASVGYLVSAYFLFRALAYVPHTTSWGTVAERAAAHKRYVDEVRSMTKSTPSADNHEA